MAVIAALFDSMSAATEAMDDLMMRHIKDLDTRAVGGKNDNTNDAPSVVVPVIPNTGANFGVPGSPLLALALRAAKLTCSMMYRTRSSGHSIMKGSWKVQRWLLPKLMMRMQTRCDDFLLSMARAHTRRNSARPNLLSAVPVGQCSAGTVLSF